MFLSYLNEFSSNFNHSKSKIILEVFYIYNCYCSRSVSSLKNNNIIIWSNSEKKILFQDYQCLNNFVTLLLMRWWYPLNSVFIVAWWTLNSINNIVLCFVCSYVNWLDDVIILSTNILLQEYFQQNYLVRLLNIIIDSVEAAIHK